MTPRSGYSVIEVLIAFAVMSMTLAVLLPGQLQLLARAGTAADRALAHDLTLSRLESMRVLGNRDTLEAPEGWRVETVSVAVLQARRVTVTIRAANGQMLAETSRNFGVRDEE